MTAVRSVSTRISTVTATSMRQISACSSDALAARAFRPTPTASSSRPVFGDLRHTIPCRPVASLYPNMPIWPAPFKVQTSPSRRWSPTGLSKVGCGSSLPPGGHPSNPRASPQHGLQIGTFISRVADDWTHPAPGRSGSTSCRSRLRARDVGVYRNIRS